MNRMLRGHILLRLTPGFGEASVGYAKQVTAGPSLLAYSDLTHVTLIPLLVRLEPHLHISLNLSMYKISSAGLTL